MHTRRINEGVFALLAPLRGYFIVFHPADCSEIAAPGFAINFEQNRGASTAAGGADAVKSFPAGVAPDLHGLLRPHRDAPTRHGAASQGAPPFHNRRRFQKMPFHTDKNGDGLPCRAARRLRPLNRSSESWRRGIPGGSRDGRPRFCRGSPTGRSAPGWPRSRRD